MLWVNIHAKKQDEENINVVNSISNGRKIFLFVHHVLRNNIEGGCTSPTKASSG